MAISINFEDLETVRHEQTVRAMTALADMVCDTKAEAKDRVEAGKVLDAMSDTIVKAQLLLENNDHTSKTVDKLGNQIKRLKNDEE